MSTESLNCAQLLRNWFLVLRQAQNGEIPLNNCRTSPNFRRLARYNVFVPSTEVFDHEVVQLIIMCHYSVIIFFLNICQATYSSPVFY